MSKTKITLTVLSLMFLFAALSSCSQAEPSASQILQDLKTQEIEWDGKSDFILKDITIDKCQVEDNYAFYWCTANLENDVYEAVATIELNYEYYKKGGWLLEDTSGCAIEQYVAKSGYSEIQAKNDASDDYGYNLTLLEHNTDIKAGIDCISFNYKREGFMLDTTGVIDCYYYFDGKKGWVLDVIESRDSDVNIHPSGVWVMENTSSKNYWYAISFESYTEDTVSVAEYFFDTLDDYYQINYCTYAINFDGDGYARFDGKKIKNRELVGFYSSETILDECSKFDFYYSLYDENYIGEVPEDALTVPDVIGLSYQDAVDKLESVGFITKKSGIGNTVTGVYQPNVNTDELLKAGTKMGKNSTIIIECE